MNKEYITKNSTIIVGLSGGPDSVCLLHWLHSLRKEKNLTLIAAHLDHEWRTDSHKDVLFCKELCASLNIPFVSKKISELNVTIKKTGSQEDVARQCRRHFLKAIATEHKATFIALGHHADDQVETFFIRLIRGTTSTGLQCMQKQDGIIIRPLLGTKKTDILAYLEKHKVNYLTDPTNTSEKHLRNRVRNTLVPALQAVDERSTANVLRAINALKESEELLESLTATFYKQVVKDESLDIKIFQTFSHALQKRIVRLWLCQKAYNFTLTESFINEVLRFLVTNRGGVHTLGSWSITKKDHHAFITD